MAAVNAEAHDGVRVMTVHAAKGLEFGVVAVPDLGRSLTAGYRPGDVVIEAGSGPDEGRFGMRLAFPTASSLGLWELQPLHEAERAAEAEEGCRLVYVAATRAERRLILSGTFKPADLEPSDEPKHTDSPLHRFLPTLAAGGWSGADGEIASPPIRIRVSEPGEARATALARRLDGPEAPGEAGGSEARPPDVEGLPRPVPVGHLSYSSLADYERCGYRFYAERVLGLAPGALALSGDEAGDGEVDDAGSPDELPEPEDDGDLAADPRARSLAFGNAVHAALEWSGRNGWGSPSPDLLTSLLAGDAGAARRALDLVEGWLESDLLADLRGGESRSEVPFAIPLGGIVVRGKIDLLVRTPRGPVVVDFKTDALRGSPAHALGDRYRAQRELYALVAADDGDGGVRAIHLFLEAPQSPVVEEMGPLELAAARERLAGLIDRIRSGDFTPTDEPSSAVCFGCPAAWNLCPHPKWRPRA
jgi:ATP-dependent helicase/nuclease subunit A